MAGRHVQVIGREKYIGRRSAFSRVELQQARLVAAVAEIIADKNISAEVDKAEALGASRPELAVAKVAGPAPLLVKIWHGDCVGIGEVQISHGDESHSGCRGRRAHWKAKPGPRFRWG